MRHLISVSILVLIFTSCAKPKIKLAILFDRVDGLATGASVENKGLKIGEVKQMNFVDKYILVEIELNNKVQVPVDSKFTVKNSILGSSKIDIEFSGKTTYLSSPDTVKGVYAQKAFMDDIISDSTKRKQIELSLQKIATGVEEIVETVRKDSVNHK
jgi:ABC-type transporter Mla subunit MlaD